MTYGENTELLSKSDKVAFKKERLIWEKLGQEDPFWAVLTGENKIGGRWELDEFLETGENDVQRYNALLSQAGYSGSYSNLLDFGCGVGRLTLAWSRIAESVIGIDISSSMVMHAKEILKNISNTDVVLNSNPDLSIFPDDQFEIVASHICLQHIPPAAALIYISEFGRVCRTGGYVIFQLPTAEKRSHTLSRIKMSLVDLLPLGLGAWYRKMKGSASVRFQVHCHNPELVIEICRRTGLILLHKEPDTSAGESLESFIYVFKKQ